MIGLHNKETYYFHTEKMVIGYNKKPLMEPITIGVEQGEIVTIIGPNGAGKSTFLKSIIGQLELIDGVAILEGTDMKSLKENEVAKKLSILMTERVKPELMTCFDVVAMGRYPYTGRFGLLTNEDRQIVSDALQMVDGLALANCDFNEISDGQKQRILLARCIAQKPKLIILDEPTSFLDIKYKIELLEILRRLKKEEHVAVIMSMHEMDFAKHISDRVICLGKDGVDRVDTPANVFTPEYIQQLFDIKKRDYERFFAGV